MACNFLSGSYYLSPKFAQKSSLLSISWKNNLSMTNSTTDIISDSEQFSIDYGKQQGKLTLENFKIEKKIGGNHSKKLFLVRDSVETSELYAMKVFYNSPTEEEKARICLFEEFGKKTKTSKLPFIAKFNNVFHKDHNTILIIEYLSGGNLFTHLKKNGKFSEQVAQFYIAELTLALESAHEFQMPMGDLTLKSLTLDENRHLKLSNYGNPSTRTFGEFHHKDFKENLYDDIAFCKMAIESFRMRGKKEYEIHMWLIGFFLYTMLTGSSPFPITDITTMNMQSTIENNEISLQKELSSPARDLINNLLKSKIKSFKEIKSHDFFKGINWECLSDMKMDPPSISKPANPQNPSIKNKPNLSLNLDYQDTQFLYNNNNNILGKERKIPITTNKRESKNKENLKQLFGV